MPFDDLPYQAVTSTTKTQVSISYRRYQGKRTQSKPRLLIGIPSAVLNSAKLNGAAYALQIGTGKDAGKIRLSPGKSGVKPSPLAGGYTFRFGYVPMLGSDSAEKDYFDGRLLDGGTIEIDAPPWFKSN